jgi:hypothetical protein
MAAAAATGINRPKDLISNSQTRMLYNITLQNILNWFLQLKTKQNGLR